MELYLLRHGDAAPADPAHGARDEDRALTERGEREARSVGQFLHRVGARPAAIFTSPLRRAVETASLVAEQLGLPPTSVQQRKALRPGADIDAIAELALEVGDGSPVLVVGHNPDFAQITGELIGRDVHVSLAKGGLARVDLEGKVRAHRGTLIWLLSPALLSD